MQVEISSAGSVARLVGLSWIDLCEQVARGCAARSAERRSPKSWRLRNLGRGRPVSSMRATVRLESGYWRAEYLTDSRRNSLTPRNARGDSACHRNRTVRAVRCHHESPSLLTKRSMQGVAHAESDPAGWRDVACGLVPFLPPSSACRNLAQRDKLLSALATACAFGQSRRSARIPGSPPSDGADSAGSWRVERISRLLALLFVPVPSSRVYKGS